MKNRFIKMLCLLVLGISLIQCSRNNEPNFTSPKVKIEAKDIENSKYNLVVPITRRDKNNSKIYCGTGFIVGPNTVLTNKHITDTDPDDHILNPEKELFVELNKNGTTTTFEIDKIIPFDNTDGVYGIEGINVDLSVIQVKPKDGKNLSDSFGSFEIAALEEIQKIKVGDTIEYAGYPMLKQPDLFYDVAVITTLYGSTKPTIDNTDTIFLHNTIFFNSITESGHSGSPILKDNKVVGIVWGAHAEKGIGYAHLFNEVSLDFINKNIK